MAAVASLKFFQHFVQLFEGFRVFGAGRVTATGIGSLQRTNHRGRNRKRSATVVGFAHKVPLRSSPTVTFKAISAELIDDVGPSSFLNSCSILRHAEHEKFPIMRRRVEAAG